MITDIFQQNIDNKDNKGEVKILPFQTDEDKRRQTLEQNKKKLGFPFAGLAS
jgi:hypothetical protein